VTAVGIPRATSAAKLGPDRIAGTATGAHSAMISVMNLCVPCSMPLAQTINGVCFATNDASDVTTERTACAGTTRRIASLFAVSPRSRVTLISLSMRTPGKKRLSRFFSRLAALPGSYSQSVTLRPARAQVRASAVPQAPPPSTAMR
jgi:hypothetical protein